MWYSGGVSNPNVKSRARAVEQQAARVRAAKSKSTPVKPEQADAADIDTRARVRLREVVTEAGASLGALGRALGWSEESARGWASRMCKPGGNIRMLDGPRLDRLAELGVSVEQLIGDEASAGLELARLVTRGGREAQAQAKALALAMLEQDASRRERLRESLGEFAAERRGGES